MRGLPSIHPLRERLPSAWEPGLGLLEWVEGSPCAVLRVSITITTSRYPLPSICVRDPVSDWFESLAQCLHWNVRKKQAHFAEDEEDGEDS